PGGSKSEVSPLGGNVLQHNMNFIGCVRSNPNNREDTTKRLVGTQTTGWEMTSCLFTISKTGVVHVDGDGAAWDQKPDAGNKKMAGQQSKRTYRNPQPQLPPTTVAKVPPRLQPSSSAPSN